MLCAIARNRFESLLQFDLQPLEPRRQRPGFEAQQFGGATFAKQFAAGGLERGLHVAALEFANLRVSVFP